MKDLLGLSIYAKHRACSLQGLDVLPVRLRALQSASPELDNNFATPNAVQGY